MMRLYNEIIKDVSISQCFMDSTMEPNGKKYFWFNMRRLAKPPFLIK